MLTSPTPSSRRNSTGSVTSGKSVSFSPKREVITFKKGKDRKDHALWLSKEDYLAIRLEATMIAKVHKSVGAINESDQHTARGLESMYQKEKTADDVKETRESVYEDNEELYAVLSKKYQRMAIARAEEDAKAAAEYQQEEASIAHPKKKSSLFKTLSPRRMARRKVPVPAV